MSSKAKRKTATASFSLSRWFEKISSTRPSSLVTSIIIIGYAIFLFGGGLYTLISSPLPAYYTGKTFLFLYPDLGQQFISDTVISTMLYALGFIGLLAIYQSTKYAYKPRQAYMMLIIGITLLLFQPQLVSASIRKQMNRRRD
jgi:hypothetical protein